MRYTLFPKIPCSPKPEQDIQLDLQAGYAYFPGFSGLIKYG